MGLASLRVTSRMMAERVKVASLYLRSRTWVHGEVVSKMRGSLEVLSYLLPR